MTTVDPQEEARELAFATPCPHNHNPFSDLLVANADCCGYLRAIIRSGDLERFGLAVDDARSMSDRDEFEDQAAKIVARTRHLLAVAASDHRTDWISEDDVFVLWLRHCARGLVHLADRTPDLATGFLAGRYAVRVHRDGVELAEIRS